jgi:ABC-2 type transport system permease protein
MTAVPVPADTAAPAADPTTGTAGAARPFRGRVTFLRLLRSESLKLVTLKSTWFALGGFVAVVGVLGTIVLAVIVAAARAEGLGDEAMDAAPLDLAALMIIQVCVLFLMAFGALAVTGEYRTGQIRSTFTAAPRRIETLLAKTVVVTLAAGVTVVVALVLAVLGGGAVTGDFSLDDGDWRVALGLVLYGGAITALSTAVGWLVRSSAASIVTCFIVFVIVPAMLPNLAVKEWMVTAFQYWPTTVGQSLAKYDAVTTAGGYPGAVAILWAYVAAALVAAGIVLNRRDA